MQMSVERFREVHKTMWNVVIAHSKEIEMGERSLFVMKKRGLRVAYQYSLLDLDELSVIEKNNCCLLCASCTSCMDCILGNCRHDKSLYLRAANGDRKAMEEIRDVVDKWPFIEFSIVTLYDK